MNVTEAGNTPDYRFAPLDSYTRDQLLADDFPREFEPIWGAASIEIRDAALDLNITPTSMGNHFYELGYFLCIRDVDQPDEWVSIGYAEDLVEAELFELVAVHFEPGTEKWENQMETDMLQVLTFLMKHLSVSGTRLEIYSES